MGMGWPLNQHPGGMMPLQANPGIQIEKSTTEFRTVRAQVGWYITGWFQNRLINLLGGFEHFLFFHILGIVTPTDFRIFFRGVGWNHQPGIFVLRAVWNRWVSSRGYWYLHDWWSLQGMRKVINWSARPPRFALQMASIFKVCWLTRPGKLSHNYGTIHHLEWVNQLFRLGHFQ